jgi:hypothetical protein
MYSTINFSQFCFTSTNEQNTNNAVNLDMSVALLYLYLSILLEIGWDGVHWIDMAQDRDQWRALVNTVLNLRVP